MEGKFGTVALLERIAVANFAGVCVSSTVGSWARDIRSNSEVPAECVLVGQTATSVALLSTASVETASVDAVLLGVVHFSFEPDRRVFCRLARGVSSVESSGVRPADGG